MPRTVRGMRVLQPIVVALPQFAKAVQEDGRRIVYFEASRDGVVDREGEIVAVDALWKSRELMLSQGDLDISHWSHLANPMTGRPQPEYRIGHPIDVRRSANGKSVFVKGEIYKSKEPPPPGSSAEWSERFWHSLTGQSPAAKWFPSVYGTITGVEMVKVRGRDVRKIVSCDWYSVGFALRAQHPDLPAVSLDPVGVFAKADGGAATTTGLAQSCHDGGAVHMTWGHFAKAVSAGVATVGPAVTDHAALTGVQALRKESLERKERSTAAPQLSYEQAKVAVLRAVKSGRVQINLSDFTRAFRAVGLGGNEARRLLSEVQSRTGK